MKTPRQIAYARLASMKRSRPTSRQIAAALIRKFAEYSEQRGDAKQERRVEEAKEVVGV